MKLFDYLDRNPQIPVLILGTITFAVLAIAESFGG